MPFVTSELQLCRHFLSELLRSWCISLCGCGGIHATIIRCVYVYFVCHFSLENLALSIYLPLNHVLRQSLNGKYVASALLVLHVVFQRSGDKLAARDSRRPCSLLHLYLWIPKTFCSVEKCSIFLRLFWDSFLPPQKCIV